MCYGSIIPFGRFPFIISEVFNADLEFLLDLFFEVNLDDCLAIDYLYFNPTSFGYFSKTMQSLMGCLESKMAGHLLTRPMIGEKIVGVMENESMTELMNKIISGEQVDQSLKLQVMNQLLNALASSTNRDQIENVAYSIKRTLKMYQDIYDSFVTPEVTSQLMHIAIHSDQKEVLGIVIVLIEKSDIQQQALKAYSQQLVDRLRDQTLKRQDFPMFSGHAEPLGLYRLKIVETLQVAFNKHQALIEADWIQLLLDLGIQHEWNNQLHLMLQHIIKMCPKHILHNLKIPPIEKSTYNCLQNGVYRGYTQILITLIKIIDDQSRSSPEYHQLTDIESNYLLNVPPLQQCFEPLPERLSQFQNNLSSILTV